ncbi:hypothetical protein JCM16358_12530 [Halanaerocella petrolearia]
MEKNQINYLVSSIILILTFFIIFPVAAEANYKLAIGDQLYISVWGHQDLQQEVTVGPDGQISFPLVGQTKAKGLTIDRLTERLTHKLQKYIKTKQSKVNIVLKKYEVVKVMVLGEVNKPGAYQLTSDKRVLDLISVAGGTTKTANLNNIQLTRGDKSLSINLKSLLAGESQEENYKLQAGDTLYISEDLVKVSVVGEVRQPGSYKVEQGTRLRDVLAQAGDVTTKASNKIKYMSQGKKKILDLERLFNNQEQNPVLKDGDTIYILESKYNFKKLSFWKNVFFFVGGLNEIKDLL